MSKDIIEVDGKDSAAGLMVWQDLKPSDKDDSLKSPRYTDELGASSELGIEVLDDAKGPVQEILTLYSVQDTVEVRRINQIKSIWFLSVSKFETQLFSIYLHTI